MQCREIHKQGEIKKKQKGENNIKKNPKETCTKFTRFTFLCLHAAYKLKDDFHLYPIKKERRNNICGKKRTKKLQTSGLHISHSKESMKSEGLLHHDLISIHSSQLLQGSSMYACILYMNFLRIK